MEPVKAELLFVLPDISGYTRFMVDNKEAPEPAQKVITQLMQSMLHAARMPLRIAEIEGDALFLYARKERAEQWAEEKKTIAVTIENFLTTFYNEIHKLAEHHAGEDKVAANIEQLGLKVVVHYGHAVIDHLERFTTINGVDAIIAHRLLKNSLRGDYILITERAFSECPFPEPGRFSPHQELYPDIGVIKTFVCRPI